MLSEGKFFPRLGRFQPLSKGPSRTPSNTSSKIVFPHKSQIVTRILCFSSERIFLETPIESQGSGLSETLSVELKLVLDVDRVTEFWTSPQTCLQVY